MATFPHHYITTSSATYESLLTVKGEGTEELKASAPTQFGGPEGNWTPEDFFSASISSCFILTFKNYTRVKKMEWRSLSVEVDAQLDKEANGLRFNKVIIRPKLEICCEGNVDPFLTALEKAEKQCLITNSINAEIEMHPKVIIKAS